jgi:hypothetical protein
MVFVANYGWYPHNSNCYSRGRMWADRDGAQETTESPASNPIQVNQNAQWLSHPRTLKKTAADAACDPLPTMKFW